jgi:hypothetical protein
MQAPTAKSHDPGATVVRSWCACQLFIYMGMNAHAICGLRRRKIAKEQARYV